MAIKMYKVLNSNTAFYIYVVLVLLYERILWILLNMYEVYST